MAGLCMWMTLGWVGGSAPNLGPAEQEQNHYLAQLFGLYGENGTLTSGGPSTASPQPGARPSSGPSVGTPWASSWSGCTSSWRQFHAQVLTPSPTPKCHIPRSSQGLHQSPVA